MELGVLLPEGQCASARLGLCVPHWTDLSKADSEVGRHLEHNPHLCAARHANLSLASAGAKGQGKQMHPCSAMLGCTRLGLCSPCQWPTPLTALPSARCQPACWPTTRSAPVLLAAQAYTGLCFFSLFACPACLQSLLPAYARLKSMQQLDSSRQGRDAGLLCMCRPVVFAHCM